MVDRTGFGEIKIGKKYSKSYKGHEILDSHDRPLPERATTPRIKEEKDED